MLKNYVQGVDSINLLPKELLYFVFDLIRIEAISNKQNVSREFSKLRSVSKKFKQEIDRSNFGEVLKFQKWHKEYLNHHIKLLIEYKKQFDAQIQKEANNHTSTRGLLTQQRVFNYDPALQQLPQSFLDRCLPKRKFTQNELFVLVVLSLAAYSAINANFLSLGEKAIYTSIALTVALFGYLLHRNTNEQTKTMLQRTTFTHENNKTDLKDLIDFIRHFDLTIDNEQSNALPLHDFLARLELCMTRFRKYARALHEHVNKHTSFSGMNLEKCINDIDSIKAADLATPDAESIRAMHINLYKQYQTKLSHYTKNIYILWKSKQTQPENANPISEQNRAYLAKPRKRRK